MSELSNQLNQSFIQSMRQSSVDTVLGRVRDLWWEDFVKLSNSMDLTLLDKLDLVMEKKKTKLKEMAVKYAHNKYPDSPDTKISQITSQFLKSNTGKMFERYIGLSIAYFLIKKNVDYCIQPFIKDLMNHCHGLTKEQFEIEVKLGNRSFKTVLDSDLFMFNPEKSHKPIILVSVKSTLKDRFHNVPF